MAVAFLITLLVNLTLASNEHVPGGPVVDRMMDRPTKFLGQALSIEGNVRTVPASRVFSMVEPGSSKPLLVILATSTPPLQPDDEVEVEGHIANLDAVAMQQKYGVDLSPERIGNWNGKPVLIGDKILRHPHKPRGR